MADNTAIEWADASLNPLRRRSPSGKIGHACLKISPGCDHCYASRMQPVRFDGQEYAAVGAEQINRLRADVAAGDVFLDQTVLEQALRWRTPRRIFVCSMTDLFGEWVPFTWIDQVLVTALLAPQHRFLLLTKRPVRMRDALLGARERVIALLRTRAQEGPNNWAIWIDRAPHGVARHLSWINRWAEDPAAWPLPNVWLGVSVELGRFSWRASVLADTPAVVRFVSAEPLLGPLPSLEVSRVDWVIAGCESGPGARPMDEDWVRDLRDRCATSGAKFFYKQRLSGGKKVGLPELDGRVWAEFPAERELVGAAR